VARLALEALDERILEPGNLGFDGDQGPRYSSSRIGQRVPIAVARRSLTGELRSVMWL
jgi:hypothetical protein